MAYTEWLSNIAEPVWEGSRHPPSTLVDPDRYIWFLAGNTTLTPIGTAMTFGFSKDTNVLPNDPPGAWSYSDQTILQEANSYNTRSHGGKNLKIGVADLKFVPTDKTLHPIIWRFGTTDPAMGNPVAFDGTQSSGGVVGDVLAFKWKDGVAPFTLKFVKLDGTVLSTQTTSNRTFTMNSTNLPAGAVYVDLYDSNGTFATTKTVLVSPSGSISVTNGENINVAGIRAMTGQVSVQNGSNMELDGGLPVTAYGSAETHNGSRTVVVPMYNISLHSGSNVDVDGRLGASYMVVTSDEVAPRYIKNSDNGTYTLYVLSSQRHVDFNTAARNGEPEVKIGEVVIDNPEFATVQKTGDHSFEIEPIKQGNAQITLMTETGEGETLINLVVLDEYPDTILVKNGSKVRLRNPWVTIEKTALLNNNTNSVQVDGLVVMQPEDISVSNANKVVVSKDYHIFLSVGSNADVSGYKQMTHYQKIDNGTNVNLDGSVVFSSEINIDSGNSTDIVTGNRVPTSGGVSVQLFGWKEEPHHELIVNGSDVQVSTGQIIIDQPIVTTRGGATVQVHGQMPADISIGYRAVSSVFRGVQMEKDDIVIENPVRIILTGVSQGGSMQDVATPCIVFHQSIVAGKEFVKGQIEEIREISLDSSIQLGVKLYSCDNALINPTTFASAYFTFDDELLLNANLDPVKSLIDVVATPVDLAILMRKKVYECRLHVVDKQGNSSIVLTRKLRFI